MNSRVRCDWCLKDDIYKKYHDEVWAVPVHDDRKLFEFLNLEGAQAGLTWYSVLVRQEGYRKAFDNWDAEKIVNYDKRKIESLLNDQGIIRNRLKVAAVINNAKCFLKVVEDYGSFSEYLWQFVDGKVIVNNPASMNEIVSRSPVSDNMSKDLKKKGFKFAGTTICYAFMQAVGMVDDHLSYCWKNKAH